MKRSFKQLSILALAAITASGCASNKTYEMGSYGYDAAFLQDHGIEIIELTSADGQARVMTSPTYQGRVMTSTAAGNTGSGFGWINYKFIDEGRVSPQFNPVGGEERFWFGPEGGPYSLYFKPGIEQVYANWLVPASIDTEKWSAEQQQSDRVVFTKNTRLTNALGTEFDIAVRRTVTLLDAKAVEASFGITCGDGVRMVAYRTENQVQNAGQQAWTHDKGLVSVWLLGMFNPTPTTTVFIPYRTDTEGVIVNDAYFGKVPSDRLIVDNGMIYFRIDGKYRSKIGIPAHRAMPLCGSYDAEKGSLTLLQTALPTQPAQYVNGQWGPQENPYAGDVINSYNDGPTDDGTIMGPFYEIETSSQALALAPAQTAVHTQNVVHIDGDQQQIAWIVKSLFGVDLDQITSKFAAPAK